MKEIKLKVKGMHCQSCAVLIKEALEDSKGVEKAVVSQRDETALVRFDESKTSRGNIKSIITKEGYKVD